MNFYIRKIFKEWLLVASIIATVTTSIYLKRFPSYSYSDFEILFILFTLFTIIKGIENSNFFYFIGKFIEKEKFIPAKLVIITYFLSMFITNDVALLLIVPLTISLNIRNKGILIIFEALAANAGSALTPFGNPQNIFIYWFYKTNFLEFFKVISPFSFLSMVIIFSLSFAIKTENKYSVELTSKNLDKKFYIHILFLIVIILIISHILPVFAGIVPLLFYIIFQRENLKIDYVLILTFLFFFGFTDNFKEMVNIKINNSSHVFLISAIISQFISNVPATLLFSDFTHNWKALLWGANVGGYGNLIGSLANLIAYRLYTNYTQEKFFTFKFIFVGYLMFLFFIIFYFAYY